jgi:charged multivesicular body protein 7
MQAYETSTATLKSVLSHPSLQRDHIETTMDALAESMADQQEIDDAIQSGGQVAVAAGAAAGVESVDEDALQKELEGLVIEREREREVEEREERKVKLLQAAEEKKQERELVDRLAALKPRQEEGDVESPSAGPDSALSGRKATADAQNGAAWEAVYEQAQARKVAEAARADASKLKKESRVSTPAQ